MKKSSGGSCEKIRRGGCEKIQRGGACHPENWLKKCSGIFSPGRNRTSSRGKIFSLFFHCFFTVFSTCFHWRQAGFFQRFFGSTKRFFNIPVRVALAACCAQGDCRWDLPPPTVLRLFHWRSLCLFGGRPMAGNRWPRSRGELVHFFSKRRARAPMAPTKASARAPRARGFWDARAPRLHDRCRKHFFRIGAIWSQPSGGTRCESLMSPSLGSEKIIWGLFFFSFWDFGANLVASNKVS